MSNTVVMKFGGTSVGSADRINQVAKRVKKYVDETGDKVVVVVSAMSGETDRLISLSKLINSENKPPVREYSQLLASGEMVSSALTSMALQELGVPSSSLMAHQVSMKTKRSFGQDLIESIDSKRIKELLSESVVPVVCGFQGIDDKGDFTLLGRGGSDTTAVAIAASLDSCPCLILTDIDGVYSAVPSLCPKAKKLDKLSYEEMLELASSGAKVLQSRSVSLARTFKVPLWVCSSFEDSIGKEIIGTEIVEEYQGMEEAVVSGITCRTDEAKVTLRNINDEPGNAAAVLTALAEVGINVDMIVQSQGESGKAELSLTMPREDLSRAKEALAQLIQSRMKEVRLESEEKMAKLSIVGEGMRNHPGIAAKIFEVLGEAKVNIELITTSEIKVSMALEEEYAERAVKVLHEHFVENVS